MAFGFENQKNLSKVGAMRLALLCGDRYVRSILAAIAENEYVHNTGKVTVIRWNDLLDERIREKETVIRRHYKSSDTLRRKVDALASSFLIHRRPNYSNTARIPHIMDFIFEELPVSTNGIIHMDKHYTGFIYPKSTAKCEFLAEDLSETSFVHLMAVISHDASMSSLRDDLATVDQGKKAAEGSMVLPIRGVNEKVPEGATDRFRLLRIL